MPGPGEIIGRWAALKIRNLLAEWKENRKNKPKIKKKSQNSKPSETSDTYTNFTSASKFN